MRDDARRKILNRRAAFIAAAMAGASVSCSRCNPLVCLEPMPVDAHTSADASVDADAGAGAGAGAGADADANAR